MSMISRHIIPPVWAKGSFGSSELTCLLPEFLFLLGILGEKYKIYAKIPLFNGRLRENKGKIVNSLS